MSYVKSFAAKFGKWVEVSLSNEEEKQAIETSDYEHREILERAFEDASEVLFNLGKKNAPFKAQHPERFGTSLMEKGLIPVAIAIFEKRASHRQYERERMAREKFENEQKEKEQDMDKNLQEATE